MWVVALARRCGRLKPPRPEARRPASAKKFMTTLSRRGRRTTMTAHNRERREAGSSCLASFARRNDKRLGANRSGKHAALPMNIKIPALSLQKAQRQGRDIRSRVTEKAWPPRGTCANTFLRRFLISSLIDRWTETQNSRRKGGGVCGRACTRPRSPVLMA